MKLPCFILAGVLLALVVSGCESTQSRSAKLESEGADLVHRKTFDVGAENRQIDVLQGRISDLLARAKSALDKGDETLAAEAAQAIATMENELAGRNETAARLEQKITRLRSTVEAGSRRVIDLKQGAIQARAVRREQDIQKKLSTTLSGSDSASEAEELINRVIGRDDPFEQAQILKEIEDGLSHRDIEDRLADAGHGAALRVTAKSVLDRLKADQAAG